MSNAKIALITGGSRGIGAAAARLFAQNGFDVCINYKTDDRTAETLRDELVTMGVRCIAVKADVSNEQDVRRLFNEVDKSLGLVTVLVNNAGILDTQCRLDEMTSDRFSHVLQTNVMSCFLCSKQAIRIMSTKYGGNGGNIVNVSSRASVSGSPNEYIDYASSKGAIDTMTKGLALEVAAEGIRVNAVRPGLIYTQMHHSGGEPDRVERLKSKIPMQRGGQPTEVAEAILWLATDKSSFVTGSVIDPSGGL
jgi:NAD(P)-dependent dehydrogenase (short-subunit alcohol dehydrogenase family)